MTTYLTPGALTAKLGMGLILICTYSEQFQMIILILFF